MRNQTTRDDAVYIVICMLNSGIYDVVGRWGRWETFCKTGNLQSKSYYHGKHESNARRAVTDLISKKNIGHYVVVAEMSTPFPWEIVVPAYPPQTQPAQLSNDPRNPTSAGVLDLD